MLLLNIVKVAYKIVKNAVVVTHAISAPEDSTLEVTNALSVSLKTVSPALMIRIVVNARSDST
jgi:hypothetical protein